MKNKLINVLFKVDLKAINDEIITLKNRVLSLNKEIDSLQSNNILLEESLELERIRSKTKDNEIEAFKIITDENKFNSFSLNFDVIFDEESEKWSVITGYCQLGGCNIASIPCDSEMEAKHQAVVLTLDNSKPSTKQACPSCYKEYLNEQI